MKQFIDFFPNCKFRYLDLAGNNRAPVSSDERRDDLNQNGYCAFFTPNGFEGATAIKNNCINLNAFYIDIDKNLTEEEVFKVRSILEPTFIIQTLHGFHFYWVLEKPIYKSETENWEEVTARWERIEQAIINAIPEADKAVKDIPRILRLPNSLYWKQTGDQYKTAPDKAFKVKGLHKDVTKLYTMEQMEAVFPVTVGLSFSFTPTVTTEKTNTIAEGEKRNFFGRVREEYPIEERDSFIRLISGEPDTLPNPNCRNNALHLTTSLMRQAGWSLERALSQFEKVGWHGLSEREIISTVKSAYAHQYTYSPKSEIIIHNMSPVESQRLQIAYTKVLKERKEQDKVRFSNYERELLAQHPHLLKNEIGIVFDYKDGVYKMMSDQEVSDMVLNGLYEDVLWGYRTKRNVSDKVACLISIIPLLVLSNDGGFIANVKNGLLDIYTRELRPHTPSFVSLVQYPVIYDPHATCPKWDECMADWMSGPEQEEKITLLKQFCGYILSSSMLYDRALFMVGDGGNGKSTFIDTIAMIIGPQATSHIDLESLYGAFGMHGLIGKRLNIIEEVHGNYYQSNKLKKLISGEQVTIDIKFKPQFTFRPQAKFVFSVNLLPRVDDTSTATERRICAVQFRNNYRKNPNFKLRSSVGLLAQELSGILNWMLDGAKDLAEKGNFIVTREQTTMLNEYREENSSVEGFLSQCIELAPEEYIEAPELYAEYKKWSLSDGGRKTKANITFTKEVKAYGAKDDRFTYQPRKTAGEEARFVGIKLSPYWVAQSDTFRDIKYD